MIQSKKMPVLLLSCLTIILNACVAKDAWLNETGRAASLPSSQKPFAEYVHENRENIREVLEEIRFQSGESPYLGSYTSEETARMRGPFQRPEQDSDMCWDKSKGGGKGFLLIHGLTDSPYLMRSISDSLEKAYPCALVRAVLLPGHGTVAGDSLSMEHEDWMSITDYGVQSFQKMDKITDVYLVGFSTGTALAIRHMREGKSDDKIKGLILISTAVKAKSKMAFAAGSVGMVTDWVDTYKERDAARYESFSYNAGAEFYELTKDIIDSKYTLDIPALMAVSADDDTIDAKAARDFFCNYTTAQGSALIWYESRNPENNSEPGPACNNIAVVGVGGTEQEYQGVPFRYANYAHTALPVNPGDKHYGVKGKYRHCKFYEAKGEAKDFDNCQQGTEKTIFGENDIKTAEAKQALGYDYWRRGTFNPDYERLEKSIVCFTDSSCSLSEVLDLSK